MSLLTVVELWTFCG